MSVIVYIESEENKIKKASLEAVSYAKKISESLKNDLIAVSFNLTDFSILNNHGVDKLYNISDEKLKVFKEHALSLRHDSRKNGIRFSDSKGWGRIRNGKKIYD